jgi:hypothetical protein
LESGEREKAELLAAVKGAGSVAGNARVATSRLGFGVAVSRLNDEVEERREERGEAGRKLTADLGTINQENMLEKVGPLLIVKS